MDEMTGKTSLNIFHVIFYAESEYLVIFWISATASKWGQIFILIGFTRRDRRLSGDQNKKHRATLLQLLAHHPHPHLC